MKFLVETTEKETPAQKAKRLLKERNKFGVAIYGIQYGKNPVYYFDPPVLRKDREDAARLQDLLRLTDGSAQHATIYAIYNDQH